MPISFERNVLTEFWVKRFDRKCFLELHFESGAGCWAGLGAGLWTGLCGLLGLARLS